MVGGRFDTWMDGALVDTERMWEHRRPRHQAVLPGDIEQKNKIKKSIYFFLDQVALKLNGRWLTPTAAHSDLEGLAAQFNPVLIQTFTLCVNPDLLCRLYVPQNKANPGWVVAFSRNKMCYNALRVFRLSPADIQSI